MPTPNDRLRAAREALSSRRLPGMPCSRDELAERVTLWLSDRDPAGRDYAMDGNHFGKLERGTVGRPAAHYRTALRAVLGATDTELGFTPTNADLAPITHSLDRPWRVDHAALDASASVLAGMRTLEDSTSAATVLPTVANLVDIIDGYTREAKLAVRPRALTLASELHTYRGWLATDTYDYDSAARHFHHGITLAAEAGAGDHLAQALSFNGFLALLQDRYTESASLVHAAQQQSTLPSLSTFYALLGARTLAIAGKHGDSDRQLAEADHLVDNVDGNDLDSRTYWYTQPFLVAQRGLVHHYAGRTTLAATDLRDGLDAMPPEQRNAAWARLMRDTLAEVS